jgi:hypothetical protein
MNFIEEKTPKGYILKILFNKWQFLAFDRRGKSIYLDREKKNLLYPVPVVIFIGTSFAVKKEFNKEYSMLKIRNGGIVVPYQDLKDNKTKYFFLGTDCELDAIPVRMMHVMDVAQMVRDIDIGVHPDYVAVDDGITPNDVIIIKNRYRVGEIIYIELANNYFLAERLQYSDSDQVVNLNMLSANPVYLACIHLRSMELAKINQLMLDFEINALETEYILSFIQKAIDSDGNDPIIEKNRPVLEDLLNSFKFYLSLLQKNEEAVKAMIDSTADPKKLTPYRTLVSKVKSMFPGLEEQKLYTLYENYIFDKLEALKVKTG